MSYQLLIDDEENWNERSLSRDIRDENYKEIMNDEDRLCPTQLKVYNALLSNPGICDKEIKKITKMSISSITGRRNDLIKMGLVSESGWKYYPDYNGCMRKNTTWEVIH